LMMCYLPVVVFDQHWPIRNLWEAIRNWIASFNWQTIQS
jgi:hypothetical protein